MPESPNLAIEPSGLVTSEAPRPQISAGEIEQPYQMLARSLDKAGQGLEQLAVPLAERAGAQAVTRDADGNIQVDRMPIFGEAGKAYARAVKVAALAEGEGAAKRADIELRERYRDDPQGYANAAQAFKDKTVQQYTAAAGPEVGNSIGQAIDNTTTFTYRGLLNEKERLDLQRAETRMTAGMNDARDDLIAMARANVPADNPAFQAAVDKYNTLANERAGNPRLAYSQEERASDLQKLQGELGAQRYLYHIDQTYKDKGYGAAAEDAKDVLTNPAYRLTEGQRQAYYSHALGEIRINDQIRRQDVAEARSALVELKERNAAGQYVPPDQINALRDTFKKLSNPAGVAAVDNAFQHKDLHDSFGQQPLSDQTQRLHALRGASMARDMYQYLIDRGEKPEHAAGMVASAVYESSLRPTAFNPAGGGQGAVGFFQWRGERLAQLKAFAASQGKGYLDPQVQMDFARRELATTEQVAGGLLRATTTPEEAARVFSLAFERGEGRDTAQRMALARSLYEGKSVDGSGGPGARSWEIANRQATIKTSATEQLKQIKADWDAGKGMPRHQDIMDVIDAAKETNNIDLGAKAELLANVMDYVEQAKQLPLEQQIGLETELRRQMEAGTAFAGADMVLKQLEARTEKIQKGLEKDPIATALSIFPDKWKTPPPLDLSNPQQFAIGLAQRAQIAQTIAQHEHIPPVAALDDQDVQKVKAALASPDLAQKAAVWGVLATLPEAVRGSTFEKIAKGDPNTRAEAGAGSMMATEPEMAKSIMAGLQIMRRNDQGILKQFEPKADGTAGFDVDLASKFPATAFDGETRFDPEGNYATMGQMIKARYTFLAANDPKGAEYSTSRLDQAINDVTGGTVRQGGVKTIAPERGMTQARFDGVMAGLTDRDVAGVTDLNGRQVTADYLRRNGRLEAVGPGQYWVNFSAPSDRPVYAYRGWGDTPGGVQRFVLDLTGRAPAAPLLAPNWPVP